jgi:glycosyltransferase involved in cell wall biosynthesis
MDIDQPEKPTVSILSTFYKGEKFLEGLLEDLVAQTIFHKCELILIDTASPGQEQAIIEPYLQSHGNIRYYRIDKRTDALAGTNEAIKKSRGKYLTIANIDDRRHPSFLECNVEHLKSAPSAALVYSDCLETRVENETFEKNSSNGRILDHSSDEFSLPNMVKNLPGPMPLWKREINEKCGLFDPSYKYAHDWDLWLKAIDHGYRFIKNNKVLGLYLSGGMSQQHNNVEQRREEAEVFFKYKHIFGRDAFLDLQPYFGSFRTDLSDWLSSPQQRIIPLE